MQSKLTKTCDTNNFATTYKEEREHMNKNILLDSSHVYKKKHVCRQKVKLVMYKFYTQE